MSHPISVSCLKWKGWSVDSTKNPRSELLEHLYWKQSDSLSRLGEVNTLLQTDDLDCAVAKSTVCVPPNSSVAHSIASETIPFDLPATTTTTNPRENSEASGTGEMRGKSDDSDTPPREKSMRDPVKATQAFHIYITIRFHFNSMRSKRTSQSPSFDVNDKPHSGRRVCSILSANTS